VLLVKVLLAAGAAAAVLLAPGVAAQATPESASCRVSIELPAKGTIHSRATSFNASLVNWEGCSVDSVSFAVDHVTGVHGSSGRFSSGAYRTAFTLQQSGKYVATGISGQYGYTNAAGVRTHGAVIGADSTAMTVKYASTFAWLPASRSGSAVTLKASAHRWSPSRHAYVRWQGATVLFQQRITGGWRTVASRRTSSTGIATAHLTSARHTWRAVLVQSPSVWGHPSHSHVA
jgi:hypothetical protein